MDKAEYHNYLLSEQWGDIRRQVITRDNSLCRICGGGAYGCDANIHHLTYRNIGNENLSDLVNLCPACHYEIHEEAAKFKGEPTFDNLYDFLYKYENRSRAFIEILGMTVARLSQQDKDGTTEQMIMDISECIKQ